MATEGYKSDSSCDLSLSCDSSPFGSLEELTGLDEVCYKCVYGSIQPYQFEPYLFDASDIEENWGNESSDDERRLQSKEWYDIDTRYDS